MTDSLQRRLEEIGAPADVKAMAAELAGQAVRDSLTGLYNRRFFDEALRKNVEVARRYKRELSLVLFDLDHFKEVNDTCGHSAGDDVLKTFAQRLQETARAADIVCRTGGDEFAIILPETGCSGIRNFTDRFFQSLEKERPDFPAMGKKVPGSWKLEASMGAAALPSDDLFVEADQNLLSAKRKRGEIECNPSR